MFRGINFKYMRYWPGTNTTIVSLSESLFVSILPWFHTEMQSSWEVPTGHCYFCKQTEEGTHQTWDKHNLSCGWTPIQYISSCEYQLLNLNTQVMSTPCLSSQTLNEDLWKPQFSYFAPFAPHPGISESKTKDYTFKNWTGQRVWLCESRGKKREEQKTKQTGDRLTSAAVLV